MSQRALIFTIAGAALLLGLFVLLRPQPPAEQAPVLASGSAVPVPPPLPKVFVLFVQQGRLASGPSVIQVTEGDEVLLRITADTADELHLHGYDLHAELAPNAATELRFKAVKSGRFEYELHRAHAEIGALEVHPR